MRRVAFVYIFFGYRDWLIAHRHVTFFLSPLPIVALPTCFCLFLFPDSLFVFVLFVGKNRVASDSIISFREIFRHRKTYGYLQSHNVPSRRSDWCLSFGRFLCAVPFVWSVVHGWPSRRTGAHRRHVRYSRLGSASWLRLCSPSARYLHRAYT